MRRFVENFKSIVLTLLIILSLVLTGSLWFSDYKGLSSLASSAYWNILNKINYEEDDSIIYDKIIVPYKVTVVNQDKERWLFYETNSMNTNAWNIIKSKLDTLTEDVEIITGQVKEWEGLFSRKSIILEFGGALSNDIFRLAIPNLPKETPAFENIEKLAIAKSLNGSTIYILQNLKGKKTLYKVLLKGEDSEIDNFISNCDNVRCNVKYVELSKIGTTTFYNNKEINSLNNVLFPVFNSLSHRDTIKQLKNTVHFNLDDEYTINRFVIDTFSNTDFAKFVTNDESYIFINDDKSSIKFEKNGIMEYTNNSKQADETVSSGKNFNVAMEFINNIHVYDNLYLLSASESDGVYTLKFSLAFDGTMVALEQPIIDDDYHAIIEIQVKEGSVKYFKGKLLDMSLGNNRANVTVFTHNILDSILKNVESNSKIETTLLEMNYMVDNVGTHYPNWMMKYNLNKSDESVVALVSTVKR